LNIPFFHSATNVNKGLKITSYFMPISNRGTNDGFFLFPMQQPGGDHKQIDIRMLVIVPAGL
jgi:hypothetical protein